MTFAEAIHGAGVADTAFLQPESWAASQASRPAGTPVFLTDAFLADAAARMEWAPELAQAVRAAAARFRASPGRIALAWHGHRLMFAGGAKPPRVPWILPGWGEDAAMLAMLALLSGLPALIDTWNRRGIPPETRRDTLSDVELWARVCRANHGVWGLADAGWLLHHFGGTLYRLGRLQFMPGEMIRFAYVFRHRATRRVQLLCPDGVAYNRAGWSYWRRGEVDEPDIWTSWYAHEGGTWRGSPITEAGVAVREPVTLPEAEWERLVAPGDPMLDIHIPAGDPLSEAACRASIARAREFFPRHLPEVPFHGFICWAWLLDPVFQKILPPDANIVRFQRLFHLFPASGSDQNVLDRIFGAKRPDLSHAPRGNRLRDAIRAFMDRGGTFAGGGGGVLREGA